MNYPSSHTRKAFRTRRSAIQLLWNQAEYWLKMALGQVFTSVCIGMAISMALIYIFSMLAVLERAWYLLYSIPYPGGFIRYYLIFEGLFISLSEVRFRFLNKHENDHLPRMSLHRFERLYQEFQSNNLDLMRFLEGWFLGSKVGDVTRCDIEEWVSSMFFHANGFF
jgi:hypothetical protein